MTTLKKEIRPTNKRVPSRNLMNFTMRKILYIVVGIILSGMALVTFRYFILLPAADKDRFALAELKLTEAINKLPAETHVSKIGKACSKTQGKYSEGSAYCYIQMTFDVKDSGAEKAQVFQVFDSVLVDSYPDLKVTTDAHQYGDKSMKCLLEAPGKQGKDGPPDQYTVRCIDQVIRYVY